MDLQKVILAILVFILFVPFCFGQYEKAEVVEGENWVDQYGIYKTTVIVFRYDRYSKVDTVKFREKLDLLKDAKFADEWEGSYSRDGEELGYSHFRWDSNSGFVDYYIYTCFPELRLMNYGRVMNTPEYIQIIPEFATDSPRKSLPVKHVKVKWGSRHYLVEESSLPAFAEKAVGIYVEPEDNSEGNNQKWSNYWVKGDLEQELPGLPEFPLNYKKFQRSPIEANIISVGRRTIEEEKQFGDESGMQYFHNNAIYPVTISAGINKSIKAGMRLEIIETGELVYITKVDQKSAVGFIPRETDDNKNDLCRDRDNIDEVLCKKIKPAFKVKTQIGKFWYF